MSSDKRPWYKWYPKDFTTDEKVQSLSPTAELVYRRLLDIMWQSNACRLLNVCFRLANVAGKGLLQEEFEKAWDEIQTEGYELFKITPCGRYIYSQRLRDQMQALEVKQKSGKKGGKASGKQRRSKNEANAKQTPKETRTDTDTDTDTDIKEKLEQKESCKTQKSQAPQNGAREIPKDFKITDDMDSWFASQGFKFISIETATAEFVDYWVSTGKRKKDWVATWRNGMRKAEQWKAEKEPEDGLRKFYQKHVAPK